MITFRRFVAALTVSLTAALSGPVMAQTKIDPEVAKTLTIEAAALVQEKGVDAVKPIFHSDPKWKFADIYVTVLDYNGVWLVYPVKPEGEGKSVLNVKDPDGHFIVQEIIKTAREQGEGWVSYRWLSPVTKQIEPKVTYVKNVPDKNVIVYVGVYK